MRSNTIIGVLIALAANLGCSMMPRSGVFNNSTYLQKHLGDAYRIHTSANGTEARYCPDNTCDVIRVPSGLNREIVIDFAFLYLSRHSTYTVIKDFQKQVSDAQVADTIVRYKTLCTDHLPSTKCVLMGMAKKYSIGLLFSRFDEGEENLTSIPIE